MSDTENKVTGQASQLIELPENVLTDLLGVLDATYEWLEKSLAGEQAYTADPATILNVIRIELQSMGEMNQGAIAQARLRLPEQD